MTTTKAIISVAGYGTRRLPITKTIEKCMLPFGNRPVVDYIVSDCVAAGITDIYFVISKGSVQLQHYYSGNSRLERYLEANGKQEALGLIENFHGINFHYVEQDVENGMYGTTIPVWLCREFIDDEEPVLIVMGDDITYTLSGESDIQQLITAGAPSLLGVPVPEGDLSKYGVIALDDEGKFSHIHEHPVAGEEPSRMINVSKYLMPGSFMKYVEASVAAGPNEKGEYFIVDAVNDFVRDGGRVSVIEAKGNYLDSGNVERWVEANQWLLENNAL